MITAYLLDKYTFKVNALLEITEYDINLDEETNSKSIIKTISKFDYQKGDFLFLFENDEQIFQGVIIDVNENKTEISIKHILNMFDKKIILENEEIIKTDGLEDFISTTITNNYINSSDNLLNINFLDIEVLTHNTFNFTPSHENRIYNLHTFLNNCTQNYNVQFDFSYVYPENRLNLKIHMLEKSYLYIDSSLSDVTNYTENINLSFISKVTVISESGLIKSWFLLNDRTITDDINNPNRVIGDEEVIYVELEEDMLQEAKNVFNGNRYNHLIEFDLNKNTEIIDLSKVLVGNDVTIKTNEDLKDSYITGLNKKSNSILIHIKIGNLRINFLDKYLKGRS